MQSLLRPMHSSQLRHVNGCPSRSCPAAVGRRVLCSVQSQQRSTAGITPKQQHQQQAEAQATPQPAAVDEALRAAQALLDSIKQGGGSPSMSSANLGYTDFGYACDASGCVLVVQQDSTNKTEAPFTHMLSGRDWSLGLINSLPSGPYHSQSFATTSFSGTETSQEFDPVNVNNTTDNSSSGSDHDALVSGPSWRVLLSVADFADFVHMLGQLRMAVASLRFQGLWHAGNKERPPSRAKWEGHHLKLTAVYAPGEPGFTVHIQFLIQEDYSSDARQITVSWPPDVTAQIIAALDDTLGFRPLAVRGT